MSQIQFIMITTYAFIPFIFKGFFAFAMSRVCDTPGSTEIRGRVTRTLEAPLSSAYTLDGWWFLVNTEALLIKNRLNAQSKQCRLCSKCQHSHNEATFISSKGEKSQNAQFNASLVSPRANWRSISNRPNLSWCCILMFGTFIVHFYTWD